MAKSILLFSGGLDSMLAAKILVNRKVEVQPVCFESYFFGAASASVSAKYLGLELRTVSFAPEHLALVKKPAFRRGKGMNPCIDCHLLMLKKAGEMMRTGGYDFVATGEVLDERPFSQNAVIMYRMEKEAGLEGMVLRPISAKLLKETLPEKKGIVDRKNLYGIKGKSRRSHIELARELGIEKFPQPAGGCLLTDPEYSKKLRELSERVPDFCGVDCRILKMGRVLWEDDFLFIVGRDEGENAAIDDIAGKEISVVKPENFPGPSLLIRSFSGDVPQRILEKGREVILRYTKKAPADARFTVKGH